MNRDLLLRIRDIRIAEMMKYFDAGCPEEYLETRESVERICALLDEEDDAKTILEFLEEL